MTCCDRFTREMNFFLCAWLKRVLKMTMTFSMDRKDYYLAVTYPHLKRAPMIGIVLHDPHWTDTRAPSSLTSTLCSLPLKFIVFPSFAAS